MGKYNAVSSSFAAGKRIQTRIGRGSKVNIHNPSNCISVRFMCGPLSFLRVFQGHVITNSQPQKTHRKDYRLAAFGIGLLLKVVRLLWVVVWYWLKRQSI